MKHLNVFTFSATGNTKHIGEKITRELEKRSLQSNGKKLIGIGFPCYGFSYPKGPVKNIIEKVQVINSRNPVQVFLFATFCLHPGTSLDEVHRELCHCGIPVVAKFSFRCPSPGFVSISTGRETGFRGAFLRYVCRFEKTLDQKVEQAAEELVKPEKLQFNRLIYLARRLTFYPARRFAHWNESRLFKNYDIDTDRCMMCLSCIKQCPENNIVRMGKRIRFINPVHCLKCMACISHCPSDCITLGASTKGKRRYTGPTTPGD